MLAFTLILCSCTCILAAGEEETIGVEGDRLS